MSTHQNQMSTLLQFAHLQMASEAFFGLMLDQPSWQHRDVKGFNIQFNNLIDNDSLINGNEHASKFSPTQAAEFANNWQTVAHIGNTTTGFSGTLFEAKQDIPAAGIVAGQRVLSFRSTEFIEDAVHDNRATNTLEIKEKGFAFGQIADMERWVAMLQEQGLLDNGVYVTGYSLGGHLATAFNILHRGEAAANGEPLIKGTYTFNGAGVGRVRSQATEIRYQRESRDLGMYKRT